MAFLTKLKMALYSLRSKLFIKKNEGEFIKKTEFKSLYSSFDDEVSREIDKLFEKELSPKLSVEAPKPVVSNTSQQDDKPLTFGDLLDKIVQFEDAKASQKDNPKVLINDSKAA